MANSLTMSKRRLREIVTEELQNAQREKINRLPDSKTISSLFESVRTGKLQYKQFEQKLNTIINEAIMTDEEIEE
jgi:hypothetical protein